MVGTLTRRIEQLEQSMGGGNDCPRCKDTMIVSFLDEAPTVLKDGYRLSPDAAERFAREEEPHGICPDCGRKRKAVVVEWGPETLPPR